MYGGPYGGTRPPPGPYGDPYGGTRPPPGPYGMRPPPERGPFVAAPQPVMAQPQAQPPKQNMYGVYGGGGRGFGGGRGYGAPRNPNFPGNTITVMSFIMLILSILLLVAQIGLYYHCGWQSVCLVLPAFVACILFIITSIIGIAAGVERTNGLILTLLVMSLIVVIVTPINMGLWGLPVSEGGIPIPFNLVGDGTPSGDTRAAIFWGLLFIPILHWILFIVIICICAFAICCPGYRFGGGVYGGGVYAPRGPVHPAGYQPSPVYGRPPPRPYCY